MGIVDTIVAKYVATMVGYYVVSRPFMTDHPRLRGMNHGDRMEEYFRSGRMLLKMAQAVGRIVLAGRELTRLAGFTGTRKRWAEVEAHLTRSFLLPPVQHA